MRKSELTREKQRLLWEIKARVKQLYKVNEGIEIKVNDFVQDIKQKISAEEDVTTGAKYIRIMTNNEDVYQQFK